MKKVIVTFMVALFATVVFGQTKIEVKPANLPHCVLDYIHQNMKDFTIDKAFKIDNKGEVTFTVIVMKGKEKQTLLFDKNCKIVKNVNPDEKKKTGAVPVNQNPDRKPLPPVKNPQTGTETTTPKK